MLETTRSTLIECAKYCSKDERRDKTLTIAKITTTKWKKLWIRVGSLFS